MSAQIKVKKFLWNTSVWVGGFEQSGPMVKKVWEKPINNLKSSNSFLILGLGCGTVAKLISKKFPNAEIVGVEIDPEIIDIGKKYFKLGEIINLEIICDDAKNFLKKTKNKFDVVIVDAYVGGNAVDFGNLKIGKVIMQNKLDLKTLKNEVTVLELAV